MILEMLLKHVKTLPTIMTIEQEVDIISKILSFSDDELLIELETLKNILDALYESHTGGAIFEVNAINQGIFQKIENRIHVLAAKVSEKHDFDMLESYADGLGAIFF